MRKLFDLPIGFVCPKPEAMLFALGFAGVARFEDLAEKACSDLRELAEPRGVREDLTITEFEKIYRGNNENASQTPLELVFPRAEHLALFAVTLGEAISDVVNSRFGERDLVAGWMLDAVASLAADIAADCAAREYAEDCKREGTLAPAVLPYSPGYCGWAVSGQERLFARLRPEEVGITLSKSSVMNPLKSVSGVLVVGVPEIHDFDNDFDFCSSCETHECEARIARVHLLEEAG